MSDDTETLAEVRESLAEWLYERSGGNFWRGETTWQDRHRAEADQWFAYADLLTRIVQARAGEGALRERIKALRDEWSADAHPEDDIYDPGADPGWFADALDAALTDTAGDPT